MSFFEIRVADGLRRIRKKLLFLQIRVGIYDQGCDIVPQG